MIELYKELVGTILDIGGGGEGVIGRLYGKQVIAIDNCQQELDEAPNCCEKVLMDATEMTFADNAFDNVTFFYTLMFMTEEEQQKALCEAARVVEPMGEVHIWDCHIDSAYPDPFCTDVDILLLDQEIHTTYGISKTDKQSVESITLMCENAGLTLETAETNGLHFYIRCRKE